ncbi:MAG: hypothetical protein K8I02_13685, partial [Candidatus Methylomirabilis sp.]|nr:hypothetical protein [Deltaproteobacteria bacterium]
FVLANELGDTDETRDSCDAHCTLAEALAEVQRCDVPPGVRLVENASYTLTNSTWSRTGSTVASRDAREAMDARDWGYVGLPRIYAKDVRIHGNGATIRRDPDSAYGFRFFHVQPGASLSIGNLTLSGGRPPYDRNAGIERHGGAVLNEGELWAGEVDFTDNLGINKGGAIFNKGVFYMTLGAATGNRIRSGTSVGGGGFLYNDAGAIAYLDRATLRDNDSGAVHGGAVFNKGLLDAWGVTFDGNESQYNGGALYVGGDEDSPSVTRLDRCTLSNNVASEGGAIDMHGAVDMTVARSTISGNAAGRIGAISVISGRLALEDVTVYGNASESRYYGASLYLSGTSAEVSVFNTIIAGGTGGLGECGFGSGSALAETASSFDSDGSCGVARSGDPMLAALGDNGGPTFTHAPRYRSPVLDVGTAVHDRDQRGHKRAGVGDADIGAYVRPCSVRFCIDIDDFDPIVPIDPFDPGIPLF